MKNLVCLIKGEVNRLIKYKILPIALVVSLIWVFIIWVSEPEFALTIIPTLIMVDATMMSIILFASSYYLEKQEGTIKSVLIAPVSTVDILMAKVFAAIVLSICSTALIVASAIFIHDISISIVLLLLYIIIIITAHIAIGFIIVLFCRDFTSMLGLYALYAFGLLIPTVLYVLKVIPEEASGFLLISPTHATQVLLDSLFNEAKGWMVGVSIGYLVIISVVLYRFVVYKRFKKAAIEG